MSFDRHHGRGGSPGSRAAAQPAATPGKRTQVELLAIPPASPAAAPPKPHHKHHKHHPHHKHHDDGGGGGGISGGGEGFIVVSGDSEGDVGVGTIEGAHPPPHHKHHKHHPHHKHHDGGGGSGGGEISGGGGISGGGEGFIVVSEDSEGDVSSGTIEDAHPPPHHTHHKHHKHHKHHPHHKHHGGGDGDGGGGGGISGGGSVDLALASVASPRDLAVAASASEASRVKDPGALRDMLIKHEAYKDVVYLDSLKKRTGGIGHLLEGTRWQVGQRIPHDQIETWYKQDVGHAIAGARQDLGAGSFDQLNGARQIVVVDMVFNMGAQADGFGGFHDTIRAIKAGQYAQAAADMLSSKWAGQVHGRAPEDAAIMRTGHLNGGGGGGDHSPGTGGHGPTLAQVRAGEAVIKMGDTGPAVAHVQRALSISADGTFGDQTLHAVERFQHAHHLKVDGIVGKKTLAALDHGAGAKDPHKDPHAQDLHDHGKWKSAPPLADVEHGKATLHEGQKGGSVRHVQRLLGVDTDGEFGPATRAAVLDFQHHHHMQRHDGRIDAHTLNILTKHPPGSIEGESAKGAEHRQRMLNVARSDSAGKAPDGRCYFHVCHYIINCGGYGKITNPYSQFTDAQRAEAHDFADLMNSGGAQRWGLERLSMTSPYHAPPGSLVVVKAGSPGTADRTAGDIAVADGHGKFYNGGLMGYGGPQKWDSSPTAHLLGVYVPR
jgi:peptidoglycan hydrolase-like protein with peptidoglycan-binding domain/GH24 family phage-related lysozyme (muramidase)